MKTHIKLFGILLLAVALLPAALAQGGAQTQPSDPTAQAQTGSVDGVRMFAGSITHEKSGFVLKAGNASFKLDDQAKAKQFKGKTVQVTGTLNESTNTIHVEKIEASASM
ncbi:MAG TPA: DUF5818 domain-containing protein [Terriglobales bacterium]|jgi:hypothetical protein|nr:DUF5818 domain-containing protein [Terriglobales bacterium]